MFVNVLLTLMIVGVLGWGWGYLVGTIVAPPVSYFIAGIGGFIVGYKLGPVLFEVFNDL